MYKIGEFSKLCRIPVKTLRYYDSEGLLTPDEVDRFTGYRYYSPSKINECNRIMALKELGFTLDEIKKHINTSNKSQTIDLIHLKEKELIVTKEHLESQLQRLDILKSTIEAEDSKVFNIVIRKPDNFKIAFIRKKFSEKKDVYNEIEQLRSKLPESIIGKRSIIINYDMEYQEEDFEIEIGVEITSKLSKEYDYQVKDIIFQTETAGLICNKDDFYDASKYMQIFLMQNKYEIYGSSYEIYYADNLIELLVPVNKITTAGKLSDFNNKVIFIDDPTVIGRWEFINCLPSINYFNINKIMTADQTKIKEIYFLPNGEEYWCFGWTKGFVISNSPYKILNKYTVKTINGQRYMFVEMKSSKYFNYKGMTDIWVFKQADNIAYSKKDIRIRDNTDLPFIYDDNVIGKWYVFDFVSEISNFDPKTLSLYRRLNNLIWKTVEFVPDGNCKIQLLKGSVCQRPAYSWTKSYVLCHLSEVAQKYDIKKIAGCEYLFIEWKSGDYIFGGFKPHYYVFRRYNVNKSVFYQP